ncbi:MAG: GAF domain-containing sensor histidine kinase [Trichodesmium sp. St16_bin4-tuft]|nr:GAF domain-containing sensor histidine kinase [Trichodesmium sp. MAG_R01]MDE5071527.1 GAF domain-containing sensor histidine kinase [Trichodesmium sp. St5_bin8]MDE5078440.1 GAF domain-containing sensor histidine kinase [Trichodesmium sp. St2_bin6]MDE5091406.1 GAF domain-containing sensor histidine kinase [Trichodesmium sp. St18_bin3_1_1]MDE5100497.1 GAF domain-containing sensor histidine kinase [Trichodesmium sp. St16_bin4-tuft]MDE5101587.1 GAF domain-containing sensor histidine kinase [Tri
MPTSTEFIGLCRTQISLVSSLGATLSIVYLTEKLAEGGEAKLIPIIVYPEIPQDEKTTSVLKVNSEIQTLDNLPKLSAAPLMMGKNYPILEASNYTKESNPGSQNHPWPKCQIVLPLIHDGVVMGLLVTAREDRPWTQKEETQIQKVAHTITVACILDQRSQWLKQQFQQQQELQVQQFDTMHNILHQLKSPLTALRTFGKLLLKKILPEDKNWNITNSILRESDRLRELIEQIDETVDAGKEILSISAESQYFQSEEIIDVHQEANQKYKPLGLLPGANFLESVFVQQVLEPLLVSAKAIANENNIDLQVDFPDNLPTIKANSKALREVLSNIIDNALKYTPIQGNIYIKLATLTPQTSHHKSINSETEEMLAIAISDTGYGISPKDLEHLFERNYRGEKAKTNIPGTGLGLAIARDLINEMQGKIQVYSPVETEWLPSYLKEQDLVINGGTTVIIWLRCEY